MTTPPPIELVPLAARRDDGEAPLLAALLASGEAALAARPLLRPEDLLGPLQGGPEGAHAELWTMRLRQLAHDAGHLPEMVRRLRGLGRSPLADYVERLPPPAEVPGVLARVVVQRAVTRTLVSVLLEELRGLRGAPVFGLRGAAGARAVLAAGAVVRAEALARLPEGT